MRAIARGFELKVFLAGRVAVETDGEVIDEALLLAFRAELDEEAPTTIPRRSVHSDQEEER